MPSLTCSTCSGDSSPDKSGKVFAVKLLQSGVGGILGGFNLSLGGRLGRRTRPAFGGYYFRVARVMNLPQVTILFRHDCPDSRVLGGTSDSQGRHDFFGAAVDLLRVSGFRVLDEVGVFGQRR